MCNPTQGRLNRGAYDLPFSGVGIEYEPLGVEPERSSITLHEAGYLPANADWNFPAVFSPFWRLYYNSDRGHCVLFDERMIELIPEQIVLIPSHCRFHFLGRNRVRNLWLTFSFTRRLASEVVPPVLLRPKRTELCLIRDLQGLIGAKRTVEPTESIRGISLALLYVVLSRPELRGRLPVPANLESVRQHIEKHLHTELRSAALATLAGLSVTGFNRAFRVHFGASPARYITQMRVRESARLLLQSNESIEAIAEQTGFCDRAHFSHVFRRVTGEGPGGFRRRHAR